MKPFHQRIPKTSNIMKTPPATIPTTAPADIPLLPPPDEVSGGGESTRKRIASEE